MPNQSHIRVNRNSATGNQVIATATTTTIIFDEESVDRLSEYDTATGLFTAIGDGVYNVAATIQWANTDANKSYYVRIFKNGSSVMDHRDLPTVTFSNLSQSISANVELSAADTISIRVFQDSGGNESIVATTDLFNVLTISKIA